MTKEEIREGIDNIVCDCCDEDVEGCRKVTCAYATDMRDLIIKYLDSQGVVLKVEGELQLPDFKVPQGQTVEIHGGSISQIIKDQGYTLTERLI